MNLKDHGFAGAVRNTIEEILLKDYNFHSDFIVGMESILSLMFIILVGIMFIMTPVFNNWLNTDWNDITPQFINAVKIPGIIECGLLFLCVIYGKDVMQMRVTKLSSAMTRKLFQQFYPIGVWVVSLVMYYAVSHKFGENWDMIYSWVRLAGFLMVLYGTKVYMLPSVSATDDTQNGDGTDKTSALLNKWRFITCGIDCGCGFRKSAAHDPQKRILLKNKNGQDQNKISFNGIGNNETNAKYNYRSLSQDNLKKFNNMLDEKSVDN